VFGLMGLLLAFSFSGAASRFDTRRELIGEEANVIDAAYLRLDLLPASAQPVLRQDFRDYLDARIRFYREVGLNPDAAKAEQSARPRCISESGTRQWPPPAMQALRPSLLWCLAAE